MTKLLIEGWRGVNHSFALVNQCQILELLRLPGVQLFHRDLPFAMAHWNAKTHDPGFAPDDWSRIAALQEPPQGMAVDAIYRICSPFRSGADCSEAQPAPGRRAPRTLSFMVTEMGLSAKSFEPGAERSDAFTRDDNLILTPTQWSRERVLDWGFAPEKVRVMTHGVNSQTFRPLSQDERDLNRRNLGFDSGHYVFLNLGAAIWNKGLDVLLLAYAILRQKHSHLRLVLKDQRSLYGIGMDSVLGSLVQSNPGLFTPEVLGSISMVTANLTQAQLRLLYGMADCYASPYRAEGFNLPVLEAIACGTPAVVTGKGATDDFCNPAVALGIDSSPGVREDASIGLVARYQEPSLDATVHAMERMALGQGIRRDAAFETARLAVIKAQSWERPARELLDLAQAATPAQAAQPEKAAKTTKTPKTAAPAGGAKSKKARAAA